MFDERLFWQLAEEKAKAIGVPFGLESVLERDQFGLPKVRILLSPKADPTGRRWDSRRWLYPFDIDVLWRVATQAVPAGVFERPTAAFMAEAVRRLLNNEGGVLVDPDGKWEGVASDAVIDSIGEILAPEIRRELAERPLETEPRYRWVPDQPMTAVLVGDALPANLTCHLERVQATCPPAPAGGSLPTCPTTSKQP